MVARVCAQCIHQRARGFHAACHEDKRLIQAVCDRGYQ